MPDRDDALAVARDVKPGLQSDMQNLGFGFHKVNHSKEYGNVCSARSTPREFDYFLGMCKSTTSALEWNKKVLESA